MIVPPIAHAGHWLAQLAYLAPLAVLVVVVVLGRLRERRERRGGGARRKNADRQRTQSVCARECRRRPERLYRRSNRKRHLART